MPVTDPGFGADVFACSRNGENHPMMSASAQGSVSWTGWPGSPFFYLYHAWCEMSLASLRDGSPWRPEEEVP